MRPQEPLGSPAAPTSRRGPRPARTVAVLAAACAVGGGLVPGPARGAAGPCSPAWPMFQHDPGRTAAACPGRTAIGPGNVATLTPRWFVPTASAVTASPTVVDGAVYVGENDGVFHALDARTGSTRWTFAIGDHRAANTGHTDHHAVSYGAIVSSAAYGVDPADGRPALYVGGGGSVFALDAATGRLRWATDTDPDRPTSPVEVESSPLLYRPPNGPLQVIVGTDVNESPGNDATGLLALDAGTGRLLWKFDPETRRVLHDLRGRPGYGCGDVWGSPALDAADDLVVFGTGNCPDPDVAAHHGVAVPSEAVWGVSAGTGAFRWVFSQAHTAAARVYGGDDDFGPTPVVSPVSRGGRRQVLAASKAGWVFALDAPSGAARWATQAAQPGQSGPSAAGAVGGFIGSAAVGRAGAATAIFAASAVPLPFKGEGPTSGDGVRPDDTSAADPARYASLHAVDVRTGRVLWHQPMAMPTYAPVTYANGVVFAPSTTAFALAAYDAATGLPLWRAPIGAAPSSAMAVVGPDVFVGAGTSESPTSQVPPQPFGVWSFGLPGGRAAGLRARGRQRG